MRRIPLVLGSFLFTLGALIFIYDIYFVLRYGLDLSDVAAVTTEGQPIEWPTGLRPAFAVPAFLYSIGIWLLAALVFALWPELGRPYSGRTWRGTE